MKTLKLLVLLLTLSVNAQEMTKGKYYDTYHGVIDGGVYYTKVNGIEFKGKIEIQRIGYGIGNYYHYIKSVNGKEALLISRGRGINQKQQQKKYNEDGSVTHTVVSTCYYNARRIVTLKKNGEITYRKTTHMFKRTRIQFESKNKYTISKEVLDKRAILRKARFEADERLKTELNELYKIPVSDLSINERQRINSLEKSLDKEETKF